LGRRASRKRRKPHPRGAESDQLARAYARGRAKDEAARAALEPLKEGERPASVTVAGVVALALGLANLIAYLAGVDIRGERPQLVGVVLYSGLMFVAAWGCFRVRYWAVLGMQALLGLALVVFSLLVIRAESVLALAIGLLVIGCGGALFWSLVKSLARLQMPDRPGGPAR
jgi:hypothetical protein